MFYKIIIFLVAYVATIMVRYRAGSQNRVVTSEPVLLVGEVPARRFFPHFYESILDPGAPIPYTDGLLQCLSNQTIPTPPAEDCQEILDLLNTTPNDMYIDGATCRTAQYGRCRAVVCAEEGPLKIRLPNGTRFDSLQATCVSRGMSGVYGTDKFGLSTLLTGF